MALRRQFAIDPEICRGCRACLKLGCPALEMGDADPKNPRLRKVRINAVLCAGCSMCGQVCKYDAMQEVIIQ